MSLLGSGIKHTSGNGVPSVGREAIAERHTLESWLDATRKRFFEVFRSAPSRQGYRRTGIFLYFQIPATYFWLEFNVLKHYFFSTCKYPSSEDPKYFRSTKNLYVWERLLEQIRHIPSTPVTMPLITYYATVPSLSFPPV